VTARGVSAATVVARCLLAVLILLAGIAQGAVGGGPALSTIDASRDVAATEGAGEQPLAKAAVGSSVAALVPAAQRVVRAAGLARALLEGADHPWAALPVAELRGQPTTLVPARPQRSAAERLAPATLPEPRAPPSS